MVYGLRNAPCSGYFYLPKIFTTIVYGELTRAGYNNHSAAVYRNDIYRTILIQILNDKHPNSKIKFTRALFELVQVEQSLYDYYMITHASKDPYSVRLDERVQQPGRRRGRRWAYTLDSLVLAYPDNFKLL